MFKNICIVALLSCATRAQTGNGVVKGTVTDASSAVVSNAKLALTNTETNIRREVGSSSLGVYYFGEIPPGSYTLAVESPGFRKWVGTLQLGTGQTSVIDPTLEVGNLEATVEVTGVASVITMEGMQVADIKDALRIHQLPLNGRSVANLFN